ncbi:hypothetical protein NNRS527_00435 [Nitrosospira sp. NRS527]|nr:hypothetical protein NNRS527_00435 [Nitrosospira sp. NRS527]
MRVFYGKPELMRSLVKRTKHDIDLLMQTGDSDHITVNLPATH